VKGTPALAGGRRIGVRVDGRFSIDYPMPEQRLEFVQMPDQLIARWV
jgi:hypothetical protein